MTTGTLGGSLHREAKRSAVLEFSTHLWQRDPLKARREKRSILFSLLLRAVLAMRSESAVTKIRPHLTSIETTLGEPTYEIDTHSFRPRAYAR